jgi:hypothetical protein
MHHPSIVYVQATTGVLHLHKGCSITRRTRYSHFPMSVVETRSDEYAHEITHAEIAEAARCHKCWDGHKGVRA